MARRVPFIETPLSITAAACDQSESLRPFQYSSGYWAAFAVCSPLTSYQPAPTETCPGTEVKSEPARVGSWQVAQETLMGWPTGARAAPVSRPSTSFQLALPEKRGSK